MIPAEKRITVSNISQRYYNLFNVLVHCQRNERLQLGFADKLKLIKKFIYKY